MRIRVEVFFTTKSHKVLHKGITKKKFDFYGYREDVHMAQTLTYLKLSGYKFGLLTKFNVRHLKDGIKRVIF